MVRLATLKLRIRNSPRSSIGCSARASQTMKRAKQTHPGEQRDPDQRVAPAVGRLLDQGEDGAAEAQRREQDPDPVDATVGVGIAALANRVQGERHGDGDQRQVDPEDPAPGERRDQRAAAGRAEHGRDPGPGGPGADRLAPCLALEGRRDDRQRAGHQQRPGDPLQGAGADQELVGGGDRAERRGRRRTRSARRRTSAGGRTGRPSSRPPASARPAPAGRPRPPTAARRGRHRAPR